MTTVVTDRADGARRGQRRPPTTAIRAPRSSDPAPRVRRRSRACATPTTRRPSIHGQREQSRVVCTARAGPGAAARAQRVPSGATVTAPHPQRRDGVQVPTADRATCSGTPISSRRCLPSLRTRRPRRSQPRHATKARRVVASVAGSAFTRELRDGPMVVAAAARIAFRAAARDHRHRDALRVDVGTENVTSLSGRSHVSIPPPGTRCTTIHAREQHQLSGLQPHESVHASRVELALPARASSSTLPTHEARRPIAIAVSPRIEGPRAGPARTGPRRCATSTPRGSRSCESASCDGDRREVTPAFADRSIADGALEETAGATSGEGAPEPHGEKDAARTPRADGLDRRPQLGDRRLPLVGLRRVARMRTASRRSTSSGRVESSCVTLRGNARGSARPVEQARDDDQRFS